VWTLDFENFETWNLFINVPVWKNKNKFPPVDEIYHFDLHFFEAQIISWPQIWSQNDFKIGNIKTIFSGLVLEILNSTLQISKYTLVVLFIGP
jgi:hypothetical protein